MSTISAFEHLHEAFNWLNISVKPGCTRCKAPLPEELKAKGRQTCNRCKSEVTGVFHNYDPILCQCDLKIPAVITILLPVGLQGNRRHLPFHLCEACALSEVAFQIELRLKFIPREPKLTLLPTPN